MGVIIRAIMSDRMKMAIIEVIIQSLHKSSINNHQSTIVNQQ